MSRGASCRGMLATCRSVAGSSIVWPLADCDRGGVAARGGTSTGRVTRYVMRRQGRGDGSGAVGKWGEECRIERKGLH